MLHRTPSRKQRDDPRTRRKYFQITCPPLMGPGLGSWLCERWEGVRRRGVPLPRQRGPASAPRHAFPCAVAPAPPHAEQRPPHAEQRPICPTFRSFTCWSGDFSDTSWPPERLPQPQCGLRRKVTLGGELLGTGRQGCPDLTE